MLWSRINVIVLCIAVLFTFHVVVEAQISFDGDNITYWSPNSTVKLRWTNGFNSDDILAMQIDFKKHGSTTTVTLAEASAGKNLTSVNPGYTVEGQATLVFNNSKLTQNGTYTLRTLLKSSAGGGVKESDVMVIILAQPNATINCNQSVELNEGGNFTCLCISAGGNPPPFVTWSKNNHPHFINQTGYLKETLLLKNVSKSDIGTYKCTVRSYNLTDDKSVQVDVRYKPTTVSFTSNGTENMASAGDYLNLTCVADGNPRPNYIITFNGTEVIIAMNETLIITNASDDNSGRYCCNASNNLGSLLKCFSLNVTNFIPSTRMTSTPSSAPTSFSSSSSTNTGTRSTPTGGRKKKSGSDNTGLIVGIVVALLVLIVVVVVLAWCYFRGSSSRSCAKRGGGDEDSPVNPSVGLHAPGENPYESVDGWKDNNQPVPGDEAGTSSSSNFPGEASAVPPVYAVVDKSKKEKKKEPKQDSLTYASLDPVALQPDSSKMRTRPQHQTDYASIDLDKLKKDQA